MGTERVAIAAVAALAAAVIVASAVALAQASRTQRCWFPWPVPTAGNFPSRPPALGKLQCGLGRRGFFAVEVSEEYTSKVLSILENDPDASKLLSDGYNVTAVRPIVTLSVAGDGSVTLKASQAVVMLRKDASWAVVRVDVAQGKVISITVLTKTVIKK